MLPHPILEMFYCVIVLGKWFIKLFYSILFQEKVWGIAYEIAAKDIPDVLEYLDFREKNGYKATWVTFYPKDIQQPPFQAKLYIATPQNEFYLGPAPLAEIAEQILTSKGPSGTNYDYLINLAQAVRNLSPRIKDSHLFELEALVKAGLPNVSSICKSI